MPVLSFLAEPAFVIPWYAFGALAAAWVAQDLHHVNTTLMKPMQWAWPIDYERAMPAGQRGRDPLRGRRRPGCDDRHGGRARARHGLLAGVLVRIRRRFRHGRFIFQYASMAMTTDNKLRALAVAFRAEFLSMLTVMGGMGAVMAREDRVEARHGQPEGRPPGPQARRA